MIRIFLLLILFWINLFALDKNDTIVNYWMDECYWGIVQDHSGNNYILEPKNGARTRTDGVIFRDGDLRDNHYLVPKTEIPLSDNYTIKLWIKWPLSDTDHKNYSTTSSNNSGEFFGGFFGGGRFSSSEKYYYNVADRKGSDDGLIFFEESKTGSRSSWQWCVNNTNNCKTFRAPNDGWHMFTFVADKNSNKTYFYIDKNKKSSISDYVGGKVSLIGTSDYKDNENNQTIGALVDEFIIFNKDLSSDDIKSVYDNEESGLNFDGSVRYANSSDTTLLEMEGGRITTLSTIDKLEWTHVDFNKSFRNPPLIFSVATKNGSDPASVRFKNITTTGFDVLIVEPQNKDGKHKSQTIDYIAINKGLHILNDRYIDVKTISTHDIRYGASVTPPSEDTVGWTNVQTDEAPTCTPVALANIQTLNNLQTSIPGHPMEPWTTAVMTKVDGNHLDMALDISEVNDSIVTKDETIGLLYMHHFSSDSFMDDYEHNITYEGQYIARKFLGWDNTKEYVDFKNSYNQDPICVGWKSSRYGSDGGWARRYKLTKKKVCFVTDEDTYHDSERKHIEEDYSFLAFSRSFHVSFYPVANYRMDECVWNGTTGEVKDISGNGYNGTAHLANTANEGVINRDGNFTLVPQDDNNDNDDDYVKLPTTSLDKKISFTLSIWMKTTEKDDFTLLSAANNSTNNEIWFNIIHSNSNKSPFKFKGYIDGNHAKNDIDLGNIGDGKWHQIVWTYFISSDSNANNSCVYVDGKRKECQTLDDNEKQFDIAGLILGQHQGKVLGGYQKKYDFAGYMDEVKIFDKVISPQDISVIYNNEKNGLNYDGSSRKAVTCSGSSTNYRFDAWDVFRGGLSDGDKNISTKIVSKNFDLNVSSLNSDGTQYQEFNGTVCSAVIDNNDNNISSWYKNSFNEDNTSSQTKEGNPTFKVTKAIKSARIKIEWIKNQDVNCPLDTETGETNSTDNFAIRPERFKIINYPKIAYAGDDFNISFEALGADDKNATDYNETNGTSFNIDVKDIKNGCITGNYKSNVKFVNGGNKTIANYDETGKIDINITDRDVSCQDRFAGVDCKDKNITGYWNSETNTSISENNITLVVLPYDINLTSSISDKKWIYMDHNLSNQNIEINVTADAYAKGNSTPLQDFNSTCYAKDINISFKVKLTNPDEFNGTYSVLKGLSTYNKEQNFTDSNFTALIDYNWTIPKNNFNHGEGNLSFIFNVDRNRSIPVSIVDTNFTDVNITTPAENLTKNENNTSLNKNILYYYGEIFTKDVSLVGDKNVSEIIPILVYDESGKYFKHQVLINWYHQEDNDINSISILGTSKNYTYHSDYNVSDFNATIKFIKPDFNLSLDSTSDNNVFVVVHFRTPLYLWYSKYADYNDSNNSTCVNHYCLEYSYKSISSGNEVGSGIFTGSEVNNSSDANVTAKGVKVYR